ncbi:MAG: sensor histidine kinase [Gammaproteobacteria bacterium]|nr:sensor histidine kinase [Gammaproteobacteria bacterium]
MKLFLSNKHIFLYLIFLIPILAQARDNTQPVNNNILKIGVRAINGVPATKKIWINTINELSQRIKGYQFELVPILGFHEMRTAVKNKKIDFVLTNPLAYTELNKAYGITRILTLNKKQPNGVASSIFSAAIFTRSNRTDINTLLDIKNKKIMAVHEEAFGGWKMALRELINQNRDPYLHNNTILFSSDNTHQSVIYSVLAGRADVGTVRTGIIEQLIAQGEIKSDSIKVLNSQHDKLSALHSTTHYPEWPFAVMPHISSELSNDIFHALLDIKPNSLSAISGNYINWVAPLDYSQVYSLSTQLDQHHITFTKIWNKHWLTILLLIVFVIAITFYTLYLLSINKKLLASELALSDHKNHLEDIVEQRTIELTEEKIKSDNANKAKSEFLSNMSHELRTPLNAILGFSQLLKMNSQNTEIQNNAEDIIDAGNYLLSLINEILDLAKIESGQSEINLEKIPCNQVLNSSLDIVRPLADIRNITINIDIISHSVVIADPIRLQQICINLLSNAVKYNKQDGNIDITIENIEDNNCRLGIKDSGLGIKEEFHHKVFEPFARDKSNTELIEGTGVGLVITKHLIEQMSGNIGFNSEYGVGTEFWVTLPLAK